VKVLTPEVRAWIYRVLIAVGAIVAGYGFMTSDQVALWIGLAGVVLNIMPTTFTSTKSDHSFQGEQ
jgi:hypothetical protein